MTSFVTPRRISSRFSQLVFGGKERKKKRLFAPLHGDRGASCEGGATIRGCCRRHHTEPVRTGLSVFCAALRFGPSSLLSDDAERGLLCPALFARRRPEHLNAFNEQLCVELSRAFEALRQDTKLRAVILTGFAPPPIHACGLRSPLPT